MEYFEWNDSLSVHDVLIDEDHKILIGMVNELHDAADLGKDYITLSSILERLAAYTREHFQREEDLMQSIAYPRYKAHKEQHRKLLERVTDLQQELNRAREMVALETAELLRFWLSSHILLSDKHLADTLHGTALIAETEQLPATD
ncbi:hemerythrin family protein [Undibacterium amnicola]|uniref:Hemerythrin family protein n=1 Tax=Undibacterium amnicola TaxID=1834038 RepID=A0ABR6XP87_9BURK|nr:bacteriohemerythrin [Undibacterium amnicola]MBC3831313.1 hemerythrin family protein [Undibacterium amnicola]